jgi:hypothetical protein
MEPLLLGFIAWVLIFGWMWNNEPSRSPKETRQRETQPAKSATPAAPKAESK